MLKLGLKGKGMHAEGGEPTALLSPKKAPQNL